MTKCKVAIVGANSYIARNFYYFLEQTPDRYEIQLYDMAPAHADGANAAYHQIAILDKASVATVDFDCDLIYFFVGKTGSANGFADFDVFLDVNERALLNFLNAMAAAHSRAKLLFPSTRLVYRGLPGPRTEDAPKEFKTIYAVNKFACEQYLAMFHNVYGLRYAILRLCIPYGTMIPQASSYGTAEFMLKKATAGENITLYGDGSVRRTLTHMTDLCEILCRCGSVEACVNDVYNIGGEDYSLREMAELIAEKYHVGIDYIPWPELAAKIESGDTVFDGTKLKNALSWQGVHQFKNWIEQS